MVAFVLLLYQYMEILWNKKGQKIDRPKKNKNYALTNKLDSDINRQLILDPSVERTVWVYRLLV